MKTVSYKGYQGSVEFEDGTLFVKVLHIDDLLIGECDKASDAERTLKDLIDAYLEDCQRLGREPGQPFKGSFNVRMTPALHREASRAAAADGMTLNAWITSAVTDKLEFTAPQSPASRPSSPKNTLLRAEPLTAARP